MFALWNQRLLTPEQKLARNAWITYKMEYLPGKPPNNTRV